MDLNEKESPAKAQKILQFIKLVELVALIISAAYAAFYWGFAFFGDKSNLGLAGLAFLFILPGTIIALAWRFIVWRSVRKISSKTKILLWIDALGPALTIIPGVSLLAGLTFNAIGFVYPLSILEYLRLPGAYVVSLIGGVILGVVILVLYLRVINLMLNPEPTTISPADQERNKKIIRNKILFGLGLAILFIGGVVVWGKIYAHRQGFDDRDHDGVLALEEERFRTNPNNPDTDSDGLDDCTELGFDRYNDQQPLAKRGGFSRYGTDPLNADTDSDGVPDGAEVAQFSNPVGPGLATQEQLNRWEVWPNRPECATRSSRKVEYIAKNNINLPLNRSSFPTENTNVNTNHTSNINTSTNNNYPAIQVSDVRISIGKAMATASWKTNVPTGGIFYYSITGANSRESINLNGYNQTSPSVTFPVQIGKVYSYTIDPCVLDVRNNPTCAPQPESQFRAE